jgi:hypothetical protein
MGEVSTVFDGRHSLGSTVAAGGNKIITEFRVCPGVAFTSSWGEQPQVEVKATPGQKTIHYYPRVSSLRNKKNCK